MTVKVRKVAASKKAAPETKAPAKKATVAKKAPAKAAGKASTKTAVKATVKATGKAAAKTAPKATPKDATAPSGAFGRSPEVDIFGFGVGSVSSLIAHAAVEGGESRIAITEAIVKQLEAEGRNTTSNGKEKYVPSLLAGVIYKLQDRGYTVEQSWRLVPPPEVQAQITALKRKQARATKKK